jgi:hypothetical protein
MMRPLVLAAAFALAAVPALAAGFHEGVYDVEGTNLDGSPYKGMAEVKLLSDTTCQITWTTGQTSSVGLCMMMNGVVAAAYRQGDMVGVTMYQINDDGTLEGNWTVAGQNGAGSEKLTPQ